MVHLPALNTPQFGWSKTRTPRHPQPLPPIYQPEVAAYPKADVSIERIGDLLEYDLPSLLAAGKLTRR